MVKTPKSIAIRLCLLILAVIGLFIGAWLFITRDIAPFDDSDLAFIERKIDSEQNPFPEIRQLEISEDRAEDLRRAILMHQDIEPMDEGFVDSVIADFEEELALFDRYAVMKDWKIDGEITIATQLPEINFILKLAQLRHVDILRELHRGKVSLAIEKTALLMKFGEGMWQCEGPIIYYLLGDVIASMTQNVSLEMLNQKKLNVDLIKALAILFDENTSSISGMVNVFRMEYKVISPVIETMGNEKASISSFAEYTSFIDALEGFATFSYKVNKTKLIFANNFRCLIREVAMNRKDASNAAEKRASEYRVPTYKKWLSGNAIGQTVLAETNSSWGAFLDRSVRIRAYHELIRLRIAMERYRLSKGAWPPDLDSLVPEFIDSIPIDPMDGEPMRYNRETLKIYSVGLDFVDDKGEADRPGLLKGKNELVIELEPESIQVNE